MTYPVCLGPNVLKMLLPGGLNVNVHGVVSTKALRAILVSLMLGEISWMKNLLHSFNRAKPVDHIDEITDAHHHFHTN